MAPQLAAAPSPAQATNQVATAKTTALHKAIAETGLLDAHAPGISLWHDYGSFALYKISDAALDSLSSSVRRQVQVGGEMDTIQFDRHPVNTLTGNANLPVRLVGPAVSGNSLHLVQFVGPIKNEWLTAVEASGARLVQYVANNAYIVWTNSNARDQLASLANHGDFVQYSGKFEPAYKLGPTIEDRILASNQDPNELVQVVVQIYDHAGNMDSRRAIEALALEVDSNWDSILAFRNVNLKVRAGDLLTIAQMQDVVWVGERLERTKTDEVQSQIMAGHLTSDGKGPSGPGYRGWLDSLGFSQNPADYPVVSIADDGVGNGSTTNGAGDLTLTRNGDGTTSRIDFVNKCTNDATANGLDGHGHINASIAFGFDQRNGFPFSDANGYLRGQGLNPYGRVGNTKIFNNSGSFNLSSCGGTDTGLIKSEQEKGALISSNSWGCAGCAGSYDDSSQAYDVGVRDANLSVAGNQEMIYIFAAGNSGSGAGTIGSPGNGKNMITVGASENQRPNDESGTWNDGCGVGGTGADNAMDVIDFSSRGPAPGQRVKPEVIAPGTHINGTASTASGYTGASVCDKYRPNGQTTFAASSGTSHSTPAVSGMASLYYWWLQNTHGIAAPSPALMKAYMVAHPTYLTGVSGNGNLPTNSQGYGMPNMELAFDGTPRALINQSVVLDNTGETWTWNGAVADPSKPVRIVMTYTDAAGSIGTSPQVNDLDLQATVGGSTYLGNRFNGQWSVTGGAADNKNNYEAVFLPSGTSGALEVKIIAKNIAGDGVPNSGDGTDQDFALVCYNCVQDPGITLAVTPTSIDVCKPDDAVYSADVGSILGFTDPATLTVSGNPTGTTTNFSANPVNPPGSSTLTIGNTSAATAGSYAMTVTASATGVTSQSANVTLNLFGGAPASATLTAPADGATDVSVTPSFSWNAAAEAATYTIQVATDAGFSNIVATQSGLSSTNWSAPMLSPTMTYYWRVQADNTCGTGTWSATFSFTTGNPPFPLPYCDVSFPNAVEPITHVVFSNIDNTSSATVGGSPALEDFTAIVGNVNAGQTYSISVQGNTAGSYSTPVKAYIDWNQDGTFANDATEGYTIGTLNNSNGSAGSQVITANIAVPPTALPGATRMRVIKKYSSAAGPCNTDGWGQAEDYTIMVGGGASYTVTPSVGTPSGTISPSTPQTVVGGLTTSFTLSADVGYHIDGVGGTCGGTLAGSVFTTNPVTANCTVIANFAVNGSGDPVIDVAPSSLSSTQDAGETQTATLTIANNGGSDLTWSIAEELARIPPVPHLYAGTSERQSARTNAAHVPFVRDWTSAVMAEALQDGGFEQGDPNPYWDVDSLNFGTVLCDASCSNSPENAPHSGSWWAWFGGINAYETGYVSQDVTIASGTATLSFWLRVPFSSGLADDYLAASIDGTEIWRITAATSGAYQTAYQHVTVDVSAFADGGTHTVRFDSTVVGGGAETSNFMLDDVSLDVDSGGGGACSAPADVPWLSEVPASGTTTAGGSSAVTVSFDSTGLAAGSYSANLCVTSNDPATPLVVVPVSLTVNSGGGSLVCNTVNHSIMESFDGTYVKWETGEFSDTGSIAGSNFNPYNSSGLAFFWPNAGTGNAGVASTATGGTWLVLNPGDVVGSGSIFNTSTTAATNWRAGADGYLGFRFACSTASACYGYAHMTTTAGSGFPATIVDYCFDADGNDITIPGGGSGDPVIDVAPSSLSSTQNAGETQTATLTIANNGGSDLNWSIDEEPARAPFDPTVSKADAQAKRVRSGAAPLSGLPLVPMAEIFDDPSFEATTGEGGPNPYWASDDSNSPGDTVFYSVGFGIPVRTGSWEVWFGGWRATSATQWFSQSITIPTSSDGNLSYWRQTILAPQGTAIMTVSVDGVTVETTDLAAAGVDSGWVQKSIDVSAFADGGAHLVKFEYTINGADDGNILIDDIALDDAGGGGTPVTCSAPSDVSWLELSSYSGTTAAGDDTPITVTFDSTGLGAGTYDANLCVTSNDPVTPLVEVPVSMTVTGGAGPVAQVTPSSFDFTVDQGASDSDAMVITNIGGGTLTWSIDEEPAFNPDPPSFRNNPAARMASELVGFGAIFDSRSGFDLTGSGAPVPLAATDISQMADNTPGNQGVACNATDGTAIRDNSWWRRFYLDEYPAISGWSAMDVQSVTVSSGGVAFPGGLPVTINLYTTPHSVTVDTINTAQLTLIGTADFVASGDLQSYTVPVTGTVDDMVNKDLVVEYHTDGATGGAWYPGANATPETHPTFISSSACSITTPTPTSGIGFPDFHLTMIVTVDEGSSTPQTCDNPANVPWLSASPSSGSLTAGDSDNVLVTVDATGMAAGSYAANLCVSTNDPGQPMIAVPVSLTVEAVGIGIFCDGFEATSEGCPVPSDIYTSGPINHPVANDIDGSSVNWITGDVQDGAVNGYHFNPYNNGNQLTFWWHLSLGNAGVAATAGASDYLVLGSGATVGPDSTWSDANNPGPAAWAAGADGYLGFRFDCSALPSPPASGVCYGYVHLTTTGAAGFPATIVDYAFERSGGPITIP